MTPGMGIGGGHLETFTTILRKSQNPLCQQIMFINQKSVSLKWYMLVFSPLFEKHHISPDFELKFANICSRFIFVLKDAFKCFSKNISNMVIYTVNDSESYIIF